MDILLIPRGTVASFLTSKIVLDAKLDFSCPKSMILRVMLLKYLSDPAYELSHEELKSVQDYFNLLIANN